MRDCVPSGTYLSKIFNSSFDRKQVLETHRRERRYFTRQIRPCTWAANSMAAYVDVPSR